MKRTPLRRKTPLNRISKRQRERNAELERSKKIVRERSGGRCERAIVFSVMGDWMYKSSSHPACDSMTEPQLNVVAEGREEVLDIRLFMAGHSPLN